MRLSDIKGERTLEVIADIIDPVANIAEDEAASNLFRKEKLPGGMTKKGFFIQRARKCVPALLRGHRDDIIAILAAIEGTPPDAYTETLNLVKLTSDVVDLLTDDAFGELFFSAQTGGSSGAAPGNTTEPGD